MSCTRVILSYIVCTYSTYAYNATVPITCNAYVSTPKGLYDDDVRVSNKGLMKVEGNAVLTNVNKSCKFKYPKHRLHIYGTYYYGHCISTIPQYIHITSHTHKIRL